MQRLGLLLLVSLALGACSGTEDSKTFVPAPEGCAEVTTGESEDRSHVAIGSPIEYETDPPSSGAHYGSWSDTGVWDTPIEDGFTVHNLEHGHIVIHHNGLEPAQVDAIAGVIDTKWVILVPRPSLEGKLALTAWGHLQLCPNPPADVVPVVQTFIDAYRNKAPESIAGEPR